MAKLSQTLSELSGQVAIVTGSSKGIGRAIAERLAQHGSRVVLSSRTPSDCQALAEEVNARHGEERAIWTRCDAGDRADLAVLIKTAMERWGRIDTVVGNALVSGDATAFIERFDEESSIVFVSSSSGIAALEDYLGYGTSKAALNHLARTLAVQLGPHNIRVNAVAPGIVASNGPDAWGTAEEQRIGVGKTPLWRLGTPDEIASCVVWLASPGGAFATGGVFLVDGGQSLKGMDGPHELRKLRRAQAGRRRPL